MNISLSPEQFIAVYNSIIVNPSREAYEVRSKMQSIILDALSTIDDSTNHNKFSHWMKKEQERLTDLQNELNSIKPIQSE